MLKLEPFGLSNPQPVFVIKNVQLRDIIPLSQGKHVRFRVCGVENGRNYSLNSVCFGMPYDSFGFGEGSVCDVVFTVDINEYMGMRTPQLFVKAVRYSESETSEIAVSNNH